MHLSSVNHVPQTELDRATGRVARAARRTLSALLCAVAIITVGCSNNNNASGYGVAWVTLTDDPGDFTSYIVNVDSITLTRNDGAVVTALATPEIVDFTKLNNVAELWGTATIPVGTYTSASIVLDYTSAVVSVMVNGLPQKATVVDSTGLPVTTQTINVILDPAAPLNIAATYATTAAQRLALDFNLAASTSSINLATSPATVTIKPYLTAGVAAPDNKMIRVRGPLINSSVDLLTYTVYVRPFFDEVDSLGSLTMFADTNTIFAINGKVTTGSAGLNQLSQSSAGTTVTAAYTTYEPTATPSATAAVYHVKYVVAGSTLEDIYTQGLEGDVVARSGNTLTVRGATLQLNDGTSNYYAADAIVNLGPSTIVIADNSAATNLNYNSVAVGQHIIVRGIYSLPASGTVTLDATGNSSTNTGSVRLISTSLWGSLVSSSSGSLLLNLQTINNWPVTDFSFAGNGVTAASDPTAANYLVNTGTLTNPDTTVGDPLWINGLVAPFASAPPDFNATTVNSELSVQMVGAASGTVSCGQGTLDCVPASLQVHWTGTGTSTPFSALTAGGMSIDLANANFSTGVIRIGPESIALTSLAASPQIVPQSGTGAAGLPAVFTPLFSYGNPLTVAPGGISVFSVFSTFATGLTTALATTPALQFEARGTYNRTTNTFSASSVNVVL
ncbi:MAG: hypothetical protein QOD56_1690 [Gammaproteobacteria bacterium]|nr:hypothetical protein [Gammaproteobacteria bacterium]